MFNLLGRFAKPENMDAALEMVRGMGVDLEVQPVKDRAAIIAAVEELARAALGAEGVQVQRLEVKGDKPMHALIVIGA